MNELLLRNVLKTIKEEPKLSNDIIDSFSDNQFRAKKTLIKHLLPYINLDTSIAILRHDAPRCQPIGDGPPQKVRDHRHGST